MQEQSLFASVGLPLGLAIIMIGIGLTLTPKGFKASVSSKKAIVWGVIGQLIFVPLFAMFLMVVLDMPGVFAIGLMLLAATPGGVTTNLFTHLGRGNVPLSIVLTVIASLAMMVTMPLWVAITTRFIATNVQTDAGLISVPPGPVIGLLLGVVAIPICIGMFIRARSASLAAKLERVLSVFGLVILVAMFVFILVDLKDQIGEIVRSSGIPVVLFTGGIMLIGWWLATAIGRPREDKIAFAIEYGLRNSTMSMVVALTVIQNTEVAAPAVLYSALMYVYGGLFVWWLRATAGKATA